MQFRKLNADEIDVRVATINEKGATLLLYKDARVDQNILDETFGIFGWKRSHQLIGDRLYCTVEVKNAETGEWIPKQDVGVESYTEKEKGQASDAFKRACFNLGIGRELYTAPFIWIGCENYNVVMGKNDKPTTYDHFRVQEIGYTENRISRLVIVNDRKNGAKVFDYGTNGPKEEEKISGEIVAGLKIACEKRHVPVNVLLDTFKVTKLEDVTVPEYRKYRTDIPNILDRWSNENTGKAD